jgi:hypothetical protein
VGGTSSIDFPVQNGFSSTYNGGLGDGFIARINFVITDDTLFIIVLSVGLPIIVIGSIIIAYKLIKRKRNDFENDNESENGSKGG